VRLVFDEVHLGPSKIQANQKISQVHYEKNGAGPLFQSSARDLDITLVRVFSWLELT